MPRKIKVPKEVKVKLLKLQSKGHSPRIQIRVPEELLKKINKEIKETHTDFSHVARAALWDYFERKEDEKR